MTHKGIIVASKTVTSEIYNRRTIDILNCETCGYSHLHPLPTIEELGEYYAYHFYEKQKPDYIEKMENESEYWNLLYSWRIKLFLNHLNRQIPKVLDVGSSSGYFLHAAKNLKCEVFGIEPSDRAAEYSKRKFNIEPQVCIYEKSDIANESMDVVHTSLVLEHLLDPLDFVQWSFTKLKPGGLFIVETPHEFNNYQNLLTQKMGYPNWFIAYPDHLNYFNQTSLKELSEKVGFFKIDGLCTYPMEQFVLQGLDYLNQPALGKEAHHQRMQFELNLLKNGGEDLLVNLYRGWAASNIGRTQIGIFKKR